MIYAFDGSPSLDKAAYICPGAAPIAATLREVGAASAARAQAICAFVPFVASSKRLWPRAATLCPRCANLECARASCPAFHDECTGGHRGGVGGYFAG